MAGQIAEPGIAELLSKTLAEEELADSLLTQIARELMGASRDLPKEPQSTLVGAASKKSGASGKTRQASR